MLLLSDATFYRKIFEKIRFLEISDFIFAVQVQTRIE